MVFRFGDCVLNGDSRQLFRAGRELHLSPKAFDLLLMLATSAPKALSKAALQERLWPDTFVAEANLPNLVGEIRSVLDDDPHRPKYIRTVARFGYACSADIRAVDEDAGISSPLQAGSHPADADFVLIRGEREWPLARGENIIGRTGEAAGWFDSSTVSRRHARIVVDGDRATLEDLDSKNGTFLKGKRLTASTPLRDGDELRLGSLTLTFHSTRNDGPTETLTVPRGATKHPLPHRGAK